MSRFAFTVRRTVVFKYAHRLQLHVRFHMHIKEYFASYAIGRGGSSVSACMQRSGGQCFGLRCPSFEVYGLEFASWHVQSSAQALVNLKQAEFLKLVCNSHLIHHIISNDKRP